MRYTLYRQALRRVYDRQFKVYGGVPEGSFWYDKKRQVLRFEVIFDQLNHILPKTYSIADIGCGYGAMLDYILQARSVGVDRYTGYDISKRLVESCRKRFFEFGAEFNVGDSPVGLVDFSVMSGTYNKTVTKSVRRWEEYVLGCLSKIWAKTESAMIFNLQSSSLEGSFISKNNIYYTKADQFSKKLSSTFGMTKVVREMSMPRDVTFVVRRC